MIKSLHINNYKSLHDLTLDVGRFNVLIGENGCGKSNVLEAIALAGAAAADKLDNEFLVSRGIRVTEPQLMRAAFRKEDSEEMPIQVTVGFNNVDVLETYILNHDNKDFSKWSVETQYTNSIYKPENISEKDLILNSALKNDKEKALELFKIILDNSDKLKNNNSRNITKLLTFILVVGIGFYAYHLLKTTKDIKTSDNDQVDLSSEKEVTKYIEYYNQFENNEEKIKNFVIYSPENTALRNFQKEGQIQPLGINGEGLLKLLKVIQSKSAEQRAEIHTSLELFDWYEQLDIPKELAGYEDKVTITDRFLSRDFDQRSANEGFLFVLFYIALMVSDDTPKIFAVDNIDAALNPKLCTQLIKELTRLAKKYDKQVFVTTHNPAILDGIDLGDDEQRLLVLSRNKQGHTRCKRIGLDDKPRSASNESLKLSEAFMRGYLGGLPKGF